MKKDNLNHIIIIILLILVFSLIIFLLINKYKDSKELKELQKEEYKLEGKEIVLGEKESPYDHIKEQNIKVFKEKVVLDINKVIWSRFADTHSMEPLLTIGANGLHIIPSSEDQIHIGDIISYYPDISGYRNKLILHRIIKTDRDEKGWYAIAKGDNLLEADPGKIRFEQVKGLLIGIIY